MANSNNPFEPITKIVRPISPCGTDRFSLELNYETDDIEFMCKIYNTVLDTVDAQNLMIDQWSEIQTWTHDMLQTYTKEQLKEWLDDGTITEMLNELYNKFEISLTEHKQEVNAQIATIDTKVNNLSASGVAPIFVSSVEDMKDINKIYVLATNAHIYYYNGTSFVDSALIYGLANGYLHFVGTNLLPTNDFNTFPSNTVYTYNNSTILKGVLNTPTTLPGILITIGHTMINGGATQIYSTQNNGFFIRTIFGNIYNEWLNIFNQTIPLNVMKSLNNSYAPGTPMSEWHELVTCYFSSDSLIPSDAPVHRQGIFYCMGGTAIAHGGIQQFYTTYLGEIFTRVLWGDSITEWIQLNKEPRIPYFALLSAYKKITCCGDSLTYSQVYTSTTSSRQAYKPYPIVIKNLLGVDVDMHADGGAYPKSWWENYNEKITHNGLYIVYLGTNYGLTRTVDTDCIGDDYTKYADTQTGYYGRILQKIKDVGGRALLVKVYVTGGSGAPNKITTNLAIEDLANRFNCAYVENVLNTDTAYHLFPDGTSLNTVHYNDLGYSYFANYLLNQIDLMSNELKTRILVQ